MSVPDNVPDPDPPDSHVFGPPGVPDPLVREVWVRIRILLSPSKNSNKNLDSYCEFFWDFLSLKNYVNVPSKSNK